MRGHYIFLLLLLSCNYSMPPTTGQLVSYNAPFLYNLSDVADYPRLKDQIIQRQQQFGAMRQPDIAAARTYLYTTIVDSLIPYWYGTPWDFNGITQVPRQGKIACGYFVTTVLRDAGFPIARIKMAQAPASELIKAVCLKGSIRHYSRLDDMQRYLAALPDTALLILGLDNHVGFVIHTNGGDFFIDASCVGGQEVSRTLLSQAIPVVCSKSYMIGNLLANDAMISRWMMQK